jgi:hypothetical protein
VRVPGFVGGSYTLNSVSQDCQRTVNLYAEADESGLGKDGEPAALVGRPDLRTLYTLGAGPIRGMYEASNGRTFVISGATLYEGQTSRGTINTRLGRAWMADNGIQLILVDGQEGWLLNFDTNVFTQITDTDFPKCSKVDYQDGYFKVNENGTRNFFISDLFDGSAWDGLDFGAKEGQPDDIITFITDHLQTILAGDRSMEVWFDSGNADFPFERVQGAFIETGIAAADSLVKFDNTVAFVGKNADGYGMAFRLQGYTPQRISTHAVEKAINGYGDISALTSFTVQINGHILWVLNFPSVTWVYSVAANQWSEWDSLASDGSHTRFRGDCHAMSGTSHLVGDFENGKVYQLVPDPTDGYQESPSPIFMRRFPHLSKSLKRLFYGSLQVDMETGIGLDGSGQGSNPKGYLRWSDDGGKTWADPLEANLGKIGNYKTRVKFDRLGSSRDRVFEFSCSEPIRQRWLSAEVQVTEGTS